MMTEGTRPRFSLDINLGHIGIICAIIGPAVVFWSDTNSTLINQQYRITQLEETQKDGFRERTKDTAELRALLSNVREEIILLKAAVNNMEKRPQ